MAHFLSSARLSFRIARTTEFKRLVDEAVAPLAETHAHRVRQRGARIALIDRWTYEDPELTQYLRNQYGRSLRDQVRALVQVATWISIATSILTFLIANYPVVAGAFAWVAMFILISSGTDDVPVGHSHLSSVIAFGIAGLATLMLIVAIRALISVAYRGGVSLLKDKWLLLTLIMATVLLVSVAVALILI